MYYILRFRSENNYCSCIPSKLGKGKLPKQWCTSGQRSSEIIFTEGRLLLIGSFEERH